MGIGFNDILNPPAADAKEAEAGLWVKIPPGFLRLPLTNAATVLPQIATYINDLLPERQREVLPTVIGTLVGLLDLLAADGARYVGIGAHTADDGTWITSTLVVSDHKLGKEKQNPRIALRDYVLVMDQAEDQGNVEPLELPDGRSALSIEKVSQLPVRRLPGEQAGPGEMTGVYQLQLLVPSTDGRRLAALEFSTPYVAYGPEFRAMMIWFATTVAFEAPEDSEQGSAVSRSITSVLGGL
jgi:hypothetical protein